MSQHQLAPRLESVDGAQLGMFCVGDARVSLAIDDRPDQRLLVRKVVIELRVAHRGSGFDVFEGGRSHAAFMDQLGRGINDADKGPPPLGCQGSLLARGAGHDSKLAPVLELIIHFLSTKVACMIQSRLRGSLRLHATTSALTDSNSDGPATSF